MRINTVQEWSQGDYLVTTDRTKINWELAHHELSQSYWATGISLALVEKSIQNSLCFSVLEVASKNQVGFARVVSDCTTFAYLGDVFVIQEHRGRGISKFLMSVIMEHPELQGLRRFCLGTRDAQELYRKFGFEISKKPENWLEIKKEDLYLDRVTSKTPGKSL